MLTPATAGELSAAEAVRGAAGPVGRLGGAWMMTPRATARGQQFGLTGWSFYYLGRAGVLGEVDASVVAATFVFFPPELLRKGWERGLQVLPLAQAHAHYVEVCREWGRQRFAGWAPAGRLADLLTQVSAAAGVGGLPLFAGWRALLTGPTAAVTDDAARCALALQVLREHRGGLHALAVLAAGIDPLQAVVSGRYGPDNAAMFGWPQPWPEPSLGTAAMAKAEQVTDALVAPAFAALTPAERYELVALLRDAGAR